MKITFLVQFIFLILLLWQPVAAQTSLCTESLADNDDDGVAAAMDIDKDNDGLIEICDLEGINEMRYQLDGSGYTTSTEAVKNIQGCPAAGCRGYELMRSVDFNADSDYRITSNKENWTTGEGWQPIGPNASRFSGIFEGNGFTISGLNINRNQSNIGLFGVVDSGSVIKNVGLLDVSIRANRAVGSLVGANRGTIINSYVTTATIVGNQRIGGLAGENRGTIINSYVTAATIVGDSEIGGLAGYNNNDIISSFAYADVTGNTRDMGGLVGLNNFGLIENTYAAGTVASTQTVVSAGGLAGVNIFSSRIRNSYTISRVMPLEGSSQVGGLVGNYNASITASYWDKTVNADLTASDDAKTTAELQNPIAPGATSADTYYGWRTAAWDFGDSIHYPTLYYATTDGITVSACADNPPPSSALPRCGSRIPNQAVRNLIPALPDLEVSEITLNAQPAANVDGTINEGGNVILMVNATGGSESYSYTWSQISGEALSLTITDTATLNVAIPPDFVELDATTAAITFQVEVNDGSLTIRRGAIITIQKINNGSFSSANVDITPTQLRIILTGTDPDGAGVFSYQWQKQELGGEWEDINDATTATYWLPADADGRIQYRVELMHTDGQGYTTEYPIQGPFKARLDDDNDRLIDIYTLEDLDAIRNQHRNMPNRCGSSADIACNGFELRRSLDFNAVESYQSGLTDPNWTTSTGSTGWLPIGSVDEHFNRVFDGNGFTISGLYINRPQSDNVGLFNTLSSGSEVKNIGLLDVNIQGGDNVGGLVGEHYGFILNSYASGAVSGNGNVGGLVGWTESVSHIINSYASGTVSGVNAVGGLVGWNKGRLRNTYATGDVSLTSASGERLGGLVGTWDRTGSIRNSYAIGRVIPGVANARRAGGLIGTTTGTEISSSYWDGKASGWNISAGGDAVTSRTTIELQSPIAPGATAMDIYYGWRVSDWDFGNSEEYPALRYAGGGLNACNTDIFIPSDLPQCGRLLPNQGRTEKVVLAVSEVTVSSQPAANDDGTINEESDVSLMVNAIGGSESYSYVWSQTSGKALSLTTINTATLNVAIAPDFVEQDATTATITFQVEVNDGMSTISRSAIITIQKINNSNPMIEVDVNPSRLRVITTGTDADGAGSFSYQWQQLVSGGWTDITDATTATYWLPADAAARVQYRAMVTHIDGQGYTTNYPTQGPFEAKLDDDNDGLIDIYTLEDLDAIRNQYSNMPTHCGSSGDIACNGFELRRSLDFNAVESYQSGMTDPNWTTSTSSTGWLPIGSDDERFNRVFEGNGFTISGLYINRPQSSYVGLFGVLSSEIKNIGLLDVNIIGVNRVGGLVGEHYGFILNSYASGAVSGNWNVGGLVGWAESVSHIINSYASGAVSGNSSIGGLVGWHKGRLRNTYATGDVSLTSASNNRLGGLVGSWETTGSIRNSYAIGRVIPGADNARDGGGLIGVTTGTVISSYWNTQTSRRSSSAGGDGAIPRSTTQLRSPTDPGATSMDTYYGWSDNDWDFGSSQDYPALRYVAGGLNACNADILTPSDLPQCGSRLPNQEHTEGVDIEVSEVTVSSQPAANDDGTINEESDVSLMVNAIGGSESYSYVWSQTSGKALSLTTTDTATLNVAIAPDFVEQDATTAAITFQVEVSDGMSTISRSAIITIIKINNRSNFDIEVDVSRSRLRVITTGTDADGVGSFSYQWQQLVSGGWMDIPDATTATYWLPADADDRVQYRVELMHTDGQGYTTEYPIQGPFRVRLDDDNNGLIDIYTLEDLDAIRNQYSNIPTRCGSSADIACNGFELRRSLDFNAADSYQSDMTDPDWTTSTGSTGWLPIGSVDEPFNRVFDGNGFTISGLYINRPQSINVGLFNTLGSGSEVKNIGLLDVNIQGRSNVGGLVGWKDDSSAIINSYASGAVSGVNQVGGLVGANGGSIINSYASGAVSGNRSGGLVGYSRMGSAIINSYASGTVSGDRIVGGLVGYNFYGSRIINSYASGAVSGNGRVGGLVGDHEGRLRNVYATGDVSLTNASDDSLGGLVGIWHGTSSIRNSYAIGRVIPGVGNARNAGGLIGNTTGTAISSYWDGEASGWNISAGGGVTSRTTMELQSPTAPGVTAMDVYYGWGDNNWDFGDDEEYPALRYIAGGMNACTTDISTPSVLPQCGSLLSNQRRTEEVALAVSEVTTSSQPAANNDGTIDEGSNVTLMVNATGGSESYSYTWSQTSGQPLVLTTTDTATLNVAIAPDFIELDAATAAITFQVEVSDGISTTNRSAIITIQKINNSDPVIEVDVNPSRLRVITTTADTDGAGSFSYQWQQLMSGGWTDITDATTATYWLPADAVARIQYRAMVTHIDGQGYTTNYPTQGPFEARFDDDNDGLIDIYTLEDLDQIRNQYLNIPNRCGGSGDLACDGFELRRSLDFNADASYRTTSNKAIWATEQGWQPIGSNANRFSGIFDGNVFTISNLSMNRAKSDLGLFSVLGTAGEIKNVGLLNISVRGHSRMGGLVGESYGSIINSYATGEVTVTGNNRSSIGGLVGVSRGSIINSYATVNVTGSGFSNSIIGGLVGRNDGSITNSYATGRVHSPHAISINIGGLVGLNDGSITNSYATGAVTGSSSIGGLVGDNNGNVTQSYWDNSATIVGAAGVAKTTAELQSPTAPTGIYSGWSSDDWDFGDSKHYPALRYAKGDNLNACATDITPSSTALPCAIALPDQKDRNTGLAGIFFFADGEPASVIPDLLFSQGIYHYDMTIVASNQHIHIRPYALNDSAEITISDQDNPNYFADKPNGALSDAISLEDNETTLTIVVTDIIDQTPTTYTFVIVRWLPLRVDVSSSRLSVIFESDDPYPDGGSFSYQWQQRLPGSGWTNIPAATTATYSLPAGASSGILYRVVDIKHTNQGGYIINYPDQGPFRISVDNDGDGLIDIYYLEDLNAMRYQLNGRAYQPNEGAEPITRGCPVGGCRGYELMRSLGFDVADSYIDSTIDTAWTISTGWQPIGSNANRFSSIFDGNGFTIRNLSMNRAKSYLGLFSVLGTAGEIKNVGLLNISVRGHSRMGGLVGESYGSIINSYATGEVTVTGNNRSSIGGLVGLSRGSIINSYATVNVTGNGSSNSIIGGLVGRNDGSITNSYATGRVDSPHAISINIGGLVGLNDGSITNSYATGRVDSPHAVSFNIGGLVGLNDGSITNSYATGAVTGSSSIGGLVGRNDGSITNSYATGAVTGSSSIGGLVGDNNGNVTQSYWDNSATIVGAAGVAKTTAELQSPTAPTGIYSGWSSDDWDFGDSKHYPALRYAKGDNLNACATDITMSSTVLPCAIALSDQKDRNTGLAGIFFFADGEPASVISDPPFSQGVYHYDMTIVASNLNIHIRPYALNDSAEITISDQDNLNYFADKPNGALSDAISLEDSETILTIVITDIIDQTPTTYTFVIVRWLPLRVDVSSSRLSVIFESDDPYPDGGSFSYQWQQRSPGSGWTDIPAATTATYSLPAAADSSLLYRVVDIKHTNQGGYIINYPDQGPFRISVDNDGDGLIDIYYLEDLNAMRYQLNGRAYQPNEDAEPITRGCPVGGCRGYELMRSLGFDVADSYIDSTIDTAWTISTGWQPIGSNANRFSSIFDGNVFTIRNLRINRAKSDLGLFSVLGTAGEIKNVGLLNISVRGHSRMGGLVGESYGSIINSYATGEVAVTGNNRSSIGGLVGLSRGSIINSYATVNVTGSRSSNSIMGGLVGYNNGGSIINSYATGTVTGGGDIGGLVGYNNGGSIINSYATGTVTGGGDIGGLVGDNNGNVTQSYWDNSATIVGAAGVAKTTAELQSPIAPTGIYSDWSSDDWDFGDSKHYPALRYAKGDNLNACADITTSSTALPCGILIPNQSDHNKGLAGIFFFADGEPASVISDPPFSQGVYHYDMTIVASNLNIHIRPYALNDSAEITISDQDNLNYFADKPNGALSDAISLEDSETTLTIVVTDIIDQAPTTYTFVIVRWLPLRVDVSSSRLSVIFESDDPYPDGGSFSYQWQQRVPGLGWTNIPAATTATYSLPAAADSSLHYRVVDIKHTDQGGYIINYPDQGPFRISADNDGDGLIDIYYLEDLDAMRYQLNGRAYQPNEGAEPIMQGCPVGGCRGYELMRSLDFNVADSYIDSTIDTAWTTSTGWQPIGSNANRFSSIFDGNGFTISNLYIDREEESDLGLFSVLHANGEIKNIGLLDVSVEGSGNNIGGLVGQNFGDIINSYASGTVSGNWYVGGLVGESHGSIINSYVTGDVSGTNNIGGLVGRNARGSIINSYASGTVKGNWYVGGLVGRNDGGSIIISSYAAAAVTGDSFVGGLTSLNIGLVVTSYWDTQTSGRAMSGGGVDKTKAELQSPTAATGIYSDWSSDDWDFGDSEHYPALRYAKGDNLNACVDITTSSEALPCGILIPNQKDRNTGLAGIVFFADGEPASVISDPLFSQGIYHYDMTIVASNLDIHLRPYALNDSAKITISDRDNPNYFTDKPNGALSDAISLEDNETTLTIVVTDNMNEVPTTYTFVVVRLLPLRVDISRSRFSVILEPAISDPDGGSFSYQWQQQAPGGSGWTDIPAATTATYSLPADADGRIRYRVTMWHTDGGDYITDYPTLGPFKASVDDDGDGLIDIYALEDLNAIRYQLDGRAYKANENADPLMLGCPVTGCKGYELMQSLDFNADVSYYTTSNKAIWTTGRGWQPIGSDDNRFSGIFEGNGYTISNLLMNREEFNLGLFSVLHANGEIKNVGLLNVSVTGSRSNIGGVVGQSFGGIINSYVTGTVTVTRGDNIGGLVGVNHNRIINSYATGAVTVTRGDNIGGLVGESHGSIINSYATGAVTVTRGDNIGGLVGESHGSIINSYATGAVTGSSDVGGLVGQNGGSIINSYASGVVDGNINVGGLVGRSLGRAIASYWNTQTSGQTSSSGGVAKTTAELQSPTAAAGIYSDWSSNNWDFGDSGHYPVLRYATDGNLNACTNNITTSSEVLPCGITLPNQRDRSQGLAGIFFFADGEPAEEVLDPLFSQGIYNYAMTIVASNLNIHLRPYALNDSAKITISDQYNPNYFADKPNGALSDAIGLKDGETTLTIVVTDTINEVPVNTTYTFAIVRLLSIRVDVSRSRLSVIFESDDPYPDGGVFSYQWQQQMVGTGWTDIADATTATYWLPADVDGRIRYRVINIKYTSRDRYIINYPNQGPFRLSVDDDGDGLIDIYTLEDLNAIRYQLNGRAYQSNENAEPLMQGCPVTGCKGYELMQSLDFNADSSYYTTSNKAIWTTGVGWQPIGSIANRFSGIFEGNGFTITNLFMNQAEPHLSLFSVSHANSRIQNVGLLDVDIEGMRSNISTLVGVNYGAIINSYATGTVSGIGTANYIGGLVGVNRGRVINSYAMIDVSGNMSIGGLAGGNFNVIMNSYALGQVSGRGNHIGGLIGYHVSGSIINSYATGMITGNSNVGGLVGQNGGSIINSYATGMITGNSNIGGLVGFDSDGSVTASYWNAETSNQLTSAGGNEVTSATTAQLQSPTTPGTKTTELYYRWSSDDWDFGDNNRYPALRYATDGNLNACVTDITTSSTTLPCAILLPDQSGREQGLAGVFFFADDEPAEVVLDPLFSQRIYSYNKIIVTTEAAVQLTLRPYALNANATITITDQDNEDYFVGKLNGALSNPIMLSEPTTLTLVVTDTINEVLVNTTYTVTIKRATPLELSAITLSLDPATPIGEGDTITLTFDVSGGSGRYEYTYLLDDQPMLSQSPFEFTLATDIVATDNTTQTVKFTIRVSDSDGQTFEHNENLTIRKVNNDPAQHITITEENSTLTVTVGSDPDGNATDPNYAYKWQQRAPAEDSPWMDIPGATEATYRVPDDTLIGTGFRVSVTYTDGQGYDETVTSDEMVYIPHAIEATGDISGATQANEGDTLTLTAPSLSGGSGEYNYTWTQTAEDSTQLSGDSALTFTSTNATLEVAIPADFIASVATSATITFKVVVDDGFTMISRSKVVTIHKIDNGLADIAITEVNGTLSVTVGTDPDGNATDPNYTYQWQQRTPEQGSPWQVIDTATAATYSVPGDTPVDTRFRVFVTYTDGQGYNKTVESNEIAYPPLPDAIEATSDISGATQANEGDTLTLTAPTVSGGSGEYHYTWTQTAEDSTQLSGKSTLTLTGDSATLEAVIPADFIASAATSATITFKVVVSDGFTMTSRSKVVTIHKINNDSPALTAEVSLARLSISLVAPDMDGEGSFSLQWQSQVAEGDWMNIDNATMPSYSVPPVSNENIRYRAVEISYKDGQGYVMNYDDQGPFLGDTMLMGDISIEGAANEGSTFTLTAPPASGGLAVYNYEWTQTADDSTHLSGYSTLTLTSTNTATVNVAIPADFIALTATSANITFKVVVDDGLTRANQSKVVTIHKINNDSPAITAEVSLSQLSISLVTPDADGEGDFSLQWQSQVSEEKWMDIANATKPTYSVPTTTNESIRYRAVNISYADGQGYVMNYDGQGPFLGKTMLMGDISGTTRADEGDTFTLTAPPASGGLAVYNYEWIQTAEDSTHLSGNNSLTLTSTTATVHVAIPADFIALTATSATITFKVVVDDGLTMTSRSKVVTIHKIDNGSSAITVEFSSSQLSLSLVEPEADGEGDFSLQWQSQMLQGEWTNITDATTATYYLPAASNQRIRYRAIDISYTDGQGYQTTYQDQGPFPGAIEAMGDISSAAQANEGDTLTLTAPPLSGGGQYNYTWTHTLADDTQLSSHSALTLTGTTATVHVAIPADFIALKATSATITFKVVVDDGFTMTSRSKVVTIYKINNDSPAITAEVSLVRLSISLVAPDADGEGHLSLQWQSQVSEGEWMNIAGATMPSYSVPTVSNENIRYRAVKISYTDGQGYVMNYDDQGPFLGDTMLIGDISIEGAANEGSTFALTAPPASGGLAVYNYEWTQTADDSTHLSGYSTLTLTSTNTATVNVAIPADFIASAAISANITFKVVVDDGLTMTSSSKVVTIHKINNDSPAITAEVSLSRLSISLVAADMDGEGDFRLQWQSQESEGEWMNIANATTATYHLPAVADISIRYRAINIRYTDGQGYVMNYDDQGPFLGETTLLGDISIKGQADEGSTFTLTAPPVSGGLAVYNYEWTQTMDDSAHLSGHSDLTLIGTTATVNVAIPADFIASAATSANITFKVVVDDGLTMTSRSKVVTIHKIDNGVADIATTEVNAILMVTVSPDPDGTATTPNYVYQWQQRTPEKDSPWLDINDAIMATYRVPGNTLVGSGFRVSVTYTDGQGYRETSTSNEIQYIAQFRGIRIRTKVFLEGPLR